MCIRDSLYFVNTANMADPAADLRELTGGTGFDDVFCYAPIAPVVELSSAVLGLSLIHIYLKALNALGLTADKAIAVEDSPTGIASAKAAGLKGLALKPRHGEPLDQSAADCIITQLMDCLLYTSGLREMFFFIG